MHTKFCIQFNLRFLERLLKNHKNILFPLLFPQAGHDKIQALQVNTYEIVVKIFHISHNLTWYSAIVHKCTRIYPVCSNYELTKQFM